MLESFGDGIETRRRCSAHLGLSLDLIPERLQLKIVYLERWYRSEYRGDSLRSVNQASKAEAQTQWLVAGSPSSPGCRGYSKRGLFSLDTMRSHD